MTPTVNRKNITVYPRAIAAADIVDDLKTKETSFKEPKENYFELSHCLQS